MIESVELHPDAVDDRTPHRVALVVFATVDAVDLVDAEHVVRGAVLREFLNSPRRVNPGELPPTVRHAPHNRQLTWDVTIGSLVSLRRALSGGYLRFEPTDHAFPHENWSDNL